MRGAFFCLPLIFSAAASGQLVLFTAQPEQPAGNVVNIGAVPVGDVLAARLRLRNAGAAPATLSTLGLSGTGFSLFGAPPLPYTLAPGATADFEARFQASSPGSYSAAFRADGISVILVAAATAAPAVSVEEGGAWRVLASGMVVDYGILERGSQTSRRFLLANRGGETLGPSPVAVSGDAFGAPSGLPPELSLAPGETVLFDVVCTPRSTGPLEGTLAVGARRFVLRALSGEPPLPQPQISISLAEPRSARQGRLAVRLASASRGRASGELRLDFEPAPGLAADPAVAFASGSRVAAFSVEEGDTVVRFGTRSSVDFQTGSTAGAIIFTLDAPGFHERSAIVVAPEPPAATAARAIRAASGVELSITGLDNTRSVSRLTFTFYGRNRQMLPPGPFNVDAGAAFRQHFAAGPGGLFLLRAVFPVAGDASQIESVEVEMVNSAGSGHTGPLPF